MFEFAIERFYHPRRILFEGSKPAIASAVLACIYITRRNLSVTVTDVAKHFGLRPATLFNAVNRFLRKIGRPGEPHAPIFDRVRAAFPPVVAMDEKKKEMVD